MPQLVCRFSQFVSNTERNPDSDVLITVLLNYTLVFCVYEHGQNKDEVKQHLIITAVTMDVCVCLFTCVCVYVYGCVRGDGYLVYTCVRELVL